MSKVYVSQEVRGLDFQRARKFGDLVFLTSGHEDFTNNGRSPVNGELADRLRRGLRDFDESVDYVVLAGSPYVNAAVMFMLGRRCMDATAIRFLRWDNRDFEYTEMSIHL